jgi:hypothetical protein
MYDMMVTYCCWLDDLIVLCAAGGTFVKKRFGGEKRCTNKSMYTSAVAPAPISFVLNQTLLTVTIADDILQLEK